MKYVFRAEILGRAFKAESDDDDASPTDDDTETPEIAFT